LTQVNEEYLGSEHKIEKNYSIGKSMTTFIGESMIRIKDFHVNKSKSLYLSPNSNFVITLGLSSCKGFKDERYQISGQTEMGDEVHNVIFIPITNTTLSATGYMGLLINDKGYLYHRILNKNNAIQVGSIDYEPKSLKFIPIYDEKFDMSSGYINYELIYSGIDGNSIKIVYREYTPDNLAKTAFFQNLTYDIDSKVIRFKKLKITINNVNNEEINFTVTEDGLAQ
jgi:hypothetical protein